MRAGLRRILVAVAGAVVTLAGCTGVPSSSSPQTITPVPLGEVSAPGAITPPDGTAPRNIVLDFLGANSSDPGTHASARTFLTPAARNRWLDTTATIIDGETVTTYKAGKPVVMRGRVLGTLNAAGMYTPSLQGTGDGGAPVPFEFGMKSVKGQWRIDSLRNGLVLTADQFRLNYPQRVLYFFDLAGQYLVPDVRYNPSVDPTQLATWMLTQLSNGPRPELQNAVNSDTMPTQANTRRLAVQVGSTIKVEIPGSTQLDAAARNRLAAQVGHTLADALSSDPVLRITDGGVAVRIPAAGSAQFTESGFSQVAGPTAPTPAVYYLRGNRILDADGRPLAGAVNNGAHIYSSIATARRGSPGTLRVAATTGAGASAQLLIGTQAEGLRQTTVRGLLSRPAWAPGREEVWVGAGPTIYRVVTQGRTISKMVVPVPSATDGGRVIALRLSPEGSRLAMVVATANGAKQLFVGSIVRAGGQVRVDALQQVSPVGAAVTDAGWVEPNRLFAIGYDASTLDARIYDTGADGSGWRESGIAGLPAPPDSLTVAGNQLAWVSADQSVWKQQGSSWTSAGITGQTAGTDPVYLE